MNTETDKAWVAGLMDGDGCITMRPSGGPFRSPQIVVDNTDLEILHELQRLYEGSLVKKAKQQAHHRQCWSWRLYGADNIITFLTDILPYMKCQAKVDRATLLTTEYKQVTHRNGRYSAEARAEKLSFESRFMRTCAGRGSRGIPALYRGGQTGKVATL